MKESQIFSTKPQKKSRALYSHTTLNLGRGLTVHHQIGKEGDHEADEASSRTSTTATMALVGSTYWHLVVDTAFGICKTMQHFFPIWADVGLANPWDQQRQRFVLRAGILEFHFRGTTSRGGGEISIQWVRRDSRDGRR